MNNFRQFAIKEEELILCNNNNATISTVAKTTGTFVYPWDIQQQAKLMNDMKKPNFIKFYNVSLFFSNIFKKKCKCTLLENNIVLCEVCGGIIFA